MEPPILVLRPSRGIRGYPTVLRHNLRGSRNKLEALCVRLQVHGLRSGRYRSGSIHRLRPPHVHKRHEPHAKIRNNAHDYACRSPYRNQDFQLADDNARGVASLQDTHAMGFGVPDNVHTGRNFRDVLPIDSDGYTSPRVLLRGGPFPLRLGRRYRLRVLRGHILLVAQGHGEDAQ